ncbi:translation initiation factor IF-2-like isoform X2 [Betta splendens]|uniref:Translation initiation factor IF-2-like isoform X2 n=1 Tax=Betta splendens TaxID=158456 RepID=A0A8M1HLA4_BETSP|nr:translation initiation factor IF-2-like isoform X2 [Betta splendens]
MLRLQRAVRRPRPRRTQRVAMQRRSPGTRGARRDASRRAAAVSVQTWASMTTEYQDRFLPPCCHKAVITTQTQRNRFHPLRGTSHDVSTYRHLKQPKAPDPTAPLPSAPPTVRQSCSSAARGSKAAGYTSVYRKDFQAWNANGRRWCRTSESHKDAAQTELDSEDAADKKERPPLESITSYRSDYVAHPLPPRATRRPVHQGPRPVSQPGPRLGPEPVSQPGPGPVSQPGPGPVSQLGPGPVSQPGPRLGPELAGPTCPASDGANELFQHFHNCSLQSKFHGVRQGDAEPTFLSTTHAHFTAHQCQRFRPALPPVRPTGGSKEPLQTTTMRAEDPEPRHSLHWGCGPAPGLKPESRTSSLSFKTSRTAACTGADPARRPAAFRSESRMCWSTSLDGGGTRPEGDRGEEPAQAQRFISCVVSRSSRGCR